MPMLDVWNVKGKSNMWKPPGVVLDKSIKAYVFHIRDDIHAVVLSKSEKDATEKFQKQVREDFKGESEGFIESFMEDISIEEVKNIIY